MQQLDRAAWSIGTLDIEAEAQASVTAGLAGFGGDYTRVRTDCRLVGRGATGDLLAAYFGDGDQTLDYRTFQDHVAPDTTSNLLFKGAVSDRSRSVYTGLIRVGKGARGTNAFQTNRNIKLSEDAWAESVPNLEIENNDVHCSHASAVGPIDEEQRFYLESRGVPTRVAERLIVAGFFAEVFDRLPANDLRPDARRRRRRQARARCWHERDRARRAAGRPARRARRCGSRSATTPSPSCASATTSTPSATAAATRTSRSPRARSTATRS